MKSYRTTQLIFDTLYYQDIGKPQTCIELLESNEKTFRSSLDYLLIRNYTYFYSYYKLGNRTKVKHWYPEVMKLKDTKIKGSKVSPLYNWEFIEAVYLSCMKDYKKSLAKFKQIDTRYSPKVITCVMRPLSTCRPENIRETAIPTAIKVKNNPELSVIPISLAYIAM